MATVDELDESKLSDAYWEKLTTIIRREIKKECESQFQGVNSRLDSMESQLNSSISGLQKSVTEHTVEIEKIRSETLPQVTDRMTELLSACTLQCLDLHVHHRKFSLVLQGVKGDAEEKPEKTRNSVIDLAKTHLKVDAKVGDFAACHRNGPAASSSIHARFLDLSTRDKFLSNAKKLAKSSQKGISISVDVPPCLRKVKKELIDMRKALPDERKRRAFVKHLPSWPYFELIERVDDKTVISTKHTFSREAVVLSALQSGLKDLEGPLDFVIK